jgi:NAD(P)-dependent dehydrogenase (short-subunit alcohol dehydrogenase family)
MPLPDFSITGKTAVITGASRGIGKGIALAFAEAGVDLCLAARSAAELEGVASQVRVLGRRCVTAQTDVGKAQDVERIAKAALRELGHVDILVCNSGVNFGKPLVPLPGYTSETASGDPNYYTPTSDAEWDMVMDTNLRGVFHCIRAFGPHMLERRQGKVIIMSSIGAVKASVKRVMYDASKAALSGLTRSLAVEWAKYGVNVNAIGPGVTSVEYLENDPNFPRIKQVIESRIPMRRLATTRDVAMLAAYLASPAAAYITGQTIFVDGGVLA